MAGKNVLYFSVCRCPSRSNCRRGGGAARIIFFSTYISLAIGRRLRQNGVGPTPTFYRSYTDKSPVLRLHNLGPTPTIYAPRRSYADDPASPIRSYADSFGRYRRSYADKSSVLRRQIIGRVPPSRCRSYADGFTSRRSYADIFLGVRATRDRFCRSYADI